MYRCSRVVRVVMIELVRLAQIDLLDGKHGVQRRRGVGVGDKFVGHPRGADGVTGSPW